MKIKQIKGGGVMKRMKGFALLDVVLAILIFAVGMLALASLQNNLTRSSVDANTRTVAANVGEEILERLRAFRRVSTDPDGVVFAFADIDEAYVEEVIPRGGVDYTVTGTVTAYDFNDDRTAVTATYPTVAGSIHDFKLVELNIAWDTSQTFKVDDDTQIASTDMNSGSVTIKQVIASIPSLATGAVAVTDDDGLGGISVDYTPGLRPDIVAINLKNGKFKESTTPQPDVIVQNELSETWFDVVTFNTVNDDVFLRREEFVVVGCLCNDIQAPNGDQKTGFLPAIWTGKEYAIWNGAGYAEQAGTELDMVPKPYGASAVNTQSVFCDTCCRDHHDSDEFTAADYQFNPELPGSEQAADGDHKHWRPGVQNEPTWVEVGYGETGPKDDYLESCRLVRKDGFMRVTQDFSQKGLVAIEEGFLDTQNGAREYSSYVAEAVRDFYENPGDTLPAPDDPYVFPGSEALPAKLPFKGTLKSQQMRSRAVYVDHVSSEAEELIECIRVNSLGYTFDPDNPDLPTPGDACDAPGVQDYLEVLPFFEVQTTFLSTWNEDPPGNPVEVSNQAITAQTPIPDRGNALLVDADAPGQLVIGAIEMNKSNTGLAVVNPVRPADSQLLSPDANNATELYIDVNDGPVDGEDPPVPIAYYWSADLGPAVGGVSWSSVEVNPSGCATPETCNTYCSRTPETLSCMRPIEAGPGRVVLSGYFKNAQTALYVCAKGSAGLSIVNSAQGVDKSAEITWQNDRNITGVTLSIEDSECIQ